ncbi:MAG: hypothetical protein J2P31_02755 [Blastocatellia bacterium]|nr:hypothetical protein [Blastocatellia bacterium]
MRRAKNVATILVAGSRLTIAARDIAGDSSIISTSYANLPQYLSEGKRIGWRATWRR